MPEKDEFGLVNLNEVEPDVFKVGSNDVLCPKIVTDGGPWAKHNMPCAVMETQHAVLELETGIFLPSWKAQKDGWMLVKVPKWLRWFLTRYEPPFRA